MIDHPRYAAKEVLGEGAQGVVVRVVDRERPEAPLVAKIRAGAADARLEGEFALLARLRIPGLVRAHDLAHSADGRAFLVEDFVDGEDPVAWSGGRPERIAALAADLADTLSMLHDAGFVHGDVKPANVRVPREGRPILLDLGAAALARARADGAAVVYTPAFAAPELAAGAPPSPATDLYALGATLFACATGAPPAARGAPLRARAPAIPPSLAAIVDSLLASHPADRPPSARDVLAALGRGPRGAFESGSRGAHVRERDVARLLSVAPGVTYVTGPSGAGKSHVAREVVTRALLGGRDARLVRFPAADASAVARIVAFLRGDAAAWPFGAASLVVLDDLHAAPAEVSEALEAYRCRVHGTGVALVATTRTAPEGASIVALGPLDKAAFDALATELGVSGAAAAALARESGGLPGWAVAALGRVPLTKEAALARVASLPDAARAEIALVACMAGVAPARVVDAAAAAPAFAAGLLSREREQVRLASPSLASDLAAALADFGVADRAAALVLADAAIPPESALAVGLAPAPPADRERVLEEAARRARRVGARALEIDALLALVASKDARTAPRLARLERLTRDAGVASAHPHVLAWLEEAAATDPALAPVALRRRAEERARAGDFEAARASALSAKAAATRSADDVEIAYALATAGAVALFAADWVAADEALVAAREKLDAVRAVEPARVDAEERARLEHNLGVVALYRGRVDDAAAAFERSLAIKRALGDRGGVRACLLNLGLALAKRGALDDADRALGEAQALAETLGQKAGRGWVLAARADVALRRGATRDAEALVAEAHAIGDALPSAIRADLALLRAQIALADGDAPAASAALARLDAKTRADDALVDARAWIVEARRRLAALPADRRGAARAAVAGARRARAGGLAEAEGEALAVLRAARGRADHGRAGNLEAPSRPAPNDDATWELLRAIGRASRDEAAALLARAVLDASSAERVFVVLVDDDGAIARAWGVDVDGFAVASPEARVDRDLVHAAKRSGVVHQPDVATRAGRGARLAAAGAHAAVIAEHRFARSAFDHVDAASAARWAVLADLVARLDAPTTPIGDDASVPGASSSRASNAASPLSTAAPVREPRREYPEIVGRSPALRGALAQLDAAVDADLPVLVRGETGTGKELFARALHDNGARAAAPFVAVNCAAIADALFEAELFGHARGAFTGADRARPGLLARAEGGTLFLDEIGELPLPRQATLLRVLESRRYRPVGADDERPFDARIVTATNRDLDACVEEGTFRRDLLYRLRVLEIVVPPLRDRGGDVEVLARHFLARAGSRATLERSALAALAAYAFPGNVRELAHLAQRLAAAGVERIDASHLPRAIRAAAADAPRKPTVDDARAEVERALARTGGNISRAAALLGLTRHGMKKRMLRLGVRARA